MNAAGLPTGLGTLCFDATPLMAFAEAGHLDLLGEWFDPAYAPGGVMVIEVGDHVGKYPHNQLILKAPWLHTVPVEEAADIAEVARIRRDYLLSTGDTDDLGEAEVIVLCQRYGWLAAMDDNEGRKYAARREVQVPTVMMLTIIIAAAAEGLIKPKDAWRVHREVDAARGGGYSYLTGQDVHKPAFMAAINEFRSLKKRHNPGDWPALLTLPGLDGFVKIVRDRH